MSTVTESSATRDSILSIGQKIMAGKGFSAVGLNEILTSSGVPKGSFYHYFASKEAFGEAMLENYFSSYLAEMDETFDQADVPAAQKLLSYLNAWHQNQSFLDCQGKCLAVKLGAEVADLSEAMRLALHRGTAAIVSRLAGAIETGVADGSLVIDGDAARVAQNLYQLWMGASLMAKIARSDQPFEVAMEATHQILHLPR